MLIGYCRVSTASQDTALQIDALTRVGAERIFSEVASGAKSDRPELLAAISYLRPGDTLVVYKLDRLGRSTRELLTLVEALAKKGVHLRSLSENIDTASPAGRLVFSTFAAMAEFERDMIRERTRDGLNAARVRGRIGGRPPALTMDQKAAARALLRGTDMSIAQVADHFGVSSATIYRHCTETSVQPPK